MPFGNPIRIIAKVLYLPNGATITNQMETDVLPWAFVTGASRGIGREIALTLAQAGFHIHVGYRSNHEAANDVIQAIEKIGRKAHALQLDLAAKAHIGTTIQQLITTHGAPEVYVHNAGISMDGLMAMMKEDAWEQVIQTNLNAFFYLVKPLAKHMIKQKKGHIVVLSSLAGVRGNAGQVNYAASKAGLIGAAKSLALELAPRGITVNVVAPGFIATEMTETLPQEQLQKYIEAIPMGRMGTAREVADVVAFLCSEKAAYITGQVLHINGGLYT